MNQAGRTKRRAKKNGKQNKNVEEGICGAPSTAFHTSHASRSVSSGLRTKKNTRTPPRSLALRGSQEEVCDEESGKKRSGKAEQQEQKRDDDDENKEPEPGLLLWEGEQQQQQELDLRPSRSIFENREERHAANIRMLQNKAKFAKKREKEEEVFSNSDEEEPPPPTACGSRFSEGYLEFLGGWKDAFLEVEKRFPDTLLSYELDDEGRVACIEVMYCDTCDGPPKHQPPFVKGKPVKYLPCEIRDGLHRKQTWMNMGPI